MASPYAEGVFLDAEGAFLYAWAVCSELRLNSDDAYFKSKPQTLNPKPCYYEFGQHELYWNLRYCELKLLGLAYEYKGVTFCFCWISLRTWLQCFIARKGKS